MQEGHWSREAGDISKATSRATLSPSPGRHWQHTGAEKLTWQLGQVCGNLLSKSQLRVKWQGSDPRTPTLCSSLHPRASYSKEIFFSHVSLPDCFFSSSFPHSKISLFPHHQPSQHRSFCQAMIPWPSIISPSIHWHPTSAHRDKPNPHLHTHMCTAGFGDTWLWAAPIRNPVEKILGAEREDKCKKKSGHMVALIKSDKVLW